MTPEPSVPVIWAVGTTRNEADVIDVNVRHHQGQGIDHFLLLDNGSTDGTTEVLTKLAREVPLEWRPHEGRFLQNHLLTMLAQEAFARGAHWVIAIDADEFWYAPGSTIREVLAHATAGALRVSVVNFVQRREQRSTTRDCLLTMTRRAPRAVGPVDQIEELVGTNQIAFVEHLYPAKWIARACPSLQIGWGNHLLFGARPPEEETDRIVCLHAPLRSRAVLERKVDGARPLDELHDYLQRAWHIRRWRAIAADDLIEPEWGANSYRDDALDVYGVRRPVVIDTRLRDLLRRWIVPEASGVWPAPQGEADHAGAARETSPEAERRMLIAGALTSQLDEYREEIAGLRREVDRHGRMLAAAEQELASTRLELGKLRSLAAEIDEKERRFSAQAETLAGLTASLERAEADLVAARRDAMKAVDQGAPERARWENAVRALEGRLSAAQRETQESERRAESERVRLEHAIRTLHESWSWRFTRPLRAALDLIVGLARRGVT